MTPEWRLIETFPDYSVSNEGYVQNNETGRRMTRMINQSGVVNVGLTRNRVQYKRAVGLLVAKAFRIPRNDAFNCAIHLDGDQLNNCVTNLLWRPRWFAVKYSQQLEEARFDDFYPIQDVDSEEVFYNPWDAAQKFGLLQVDILLSICNGTPVWPTQQRFCKFDAGADILSPRKLAI